MPHQTNEIVIYTYITLGWTLLGQYYGIDKINIEISLILNTVEQKNCWLRQCSTCSVHVLPLSDCIVLYQVRPPAILRRLQARSDGAPARRRGDTLQPAPTAPTLP